ncbi:hypothetical protein ACR30L_00675 [Psychromonas sp. PT13]|uniref:hypothetical protein n=1 Tax=Psychromonas sp. PT13 TaxID=3439547 RepID=UPI003EB6D6DE
MKKKFTLHLDAILVIALLFFVSMGLNAFLYTQVDVLTEENKTLQWQGVEDSFNLSSQGTYIKKLEADLEQLKQD